jgi:hypothetical protein
MKLFEFVCKYDPSMMYIEAVIFKASGLLACFRLSSALSSTPGAVSNLIL